jgi:hypothetical protein
LRERLNRVSIQRRHRNPIDVTQPHAERTRDDVLWADGRRKDVGKDAGEPTGHLMFTVIGAIACFERELMLERQREGIAKAKAEGVEFAIWAMAVRGIVLGSSRPAVRNYDYETARHTRC